MAPVYGVHEEPFNITLNFITFIMVASSLELVHDKSTQELSHAALCLLFLVPNHELIIYIDTKVKFRHLKILTCKVTLQQSL